MTCDIKENIFFFIQYSLKQNYFKSCLYASVPALCNNLASEALRHTVGAEKEYRFSVLNRSALGQIAAKPVKKNNFKFWKLQTKQ